jgi:hypothetical protein
MNDLGLIIYGDITSSDRRFFQESKTNMSFLSGSSTRSDAESAPPEASDLFLRISAECTRLVEREGKQIPSQWDMSDLLRTLIGNDNIPGFLSHTYYDVMLLGPNSWLFLDIINWIDLVNYVPPQV